MTSDHRGARTRPTRRSFLTLSTLTGLGASTIALGIAAPAEAISDPAATPMPDDPFGLGVASGDPSPDGVVLWTRLAPTPLAADGHGGMPRQRQVVEWEVAEDERFTRVVRRGRAMAAPDLAHAVHPEVRGLRPGRDYFYRFRAGGRISPVGHTRTAPAPDAMPARLKIIGASCQAWYHGHYSAYRHMLAEDPDLVLFLGDYIYEYAINDSNLWREGIDPLPDEHNAQIQTLEQYRLRYALFKSDPLLQAMHAAAPWALTMDDHEVENNWADENSSRNTPAYHFLRQRAVAFRAYYENAPFRSTATPSGPDLPLYRRLRFGRLAQLDIVDTRQYRSDYPCSSVLSDCPERNDPDRTVLGREQERWLEDGFGDSVATWNVLGQQTVVSRIDRTYDEPEQLWSTDQWDGFPAAQDRLFDALARHRIENLVSIGGDIHRGVACEIKPDIFDPESPAVGVELVSTSIASNGDGSDHDGLAGLWLENPHVKFYSARRGYVSATFTPTELLSEFRAVPYVQADDEAPVTTVARFRTEAGRPALLPEG